MTHQDDEIPATRWELAGEGNLGYAERFTDLITTGADITGEARLADVLVPRGARILDAGSGLGRIGAALQRGGHRVVAVEKDRHLIGLSRTHFPDLPVLESDILGISPQMLREAGAPEEFDLVVLVGNVIVLAAEDTEVRMLRRLASLLAPGGRILVGFHLQGGPCSGRDYTVAEFAEHVAEAGLVIQQHFGTYELHPPSDEYVVAILEAGR